MTIITKNNFNDFIESDIVLIDFWGDNCPGCKAIEKTLEQIEKEAELKIGKCKVEDNIELMQMFNIMSLPTLLIFKNGELKNMLIGNVSKEKILNNIGEVK